MSPRCATARCSSSRATAFAEPGCRVPRRAARDHDAGRAPARAIAPRGQPHQPGRHDRGRAAERRPGATGFAARLRDALERLTGAASNVTARGDDRRARRPRARAAPTDWRRGSPSASAGFEAVVYAADPEPNEWTAACVRQADLVLLVGAAGEEPSARGGRARDRSAARARCATRTELVLVHPPAHTGSARHAAWLLDRTVDRHHHVRVDRDGDVDRVARLLLGRGHRRGVQRRRRARRRRRSACSRR